MLGGKGGGDLEDDFWSRRSKEPGNLEHDL
jgi:hypothetical protein